MSTVQSRLLQKLGLSLKKNGNPWGCIPSLLGCTRKQTEQARKQGSPWPLGPALNSQGGKCDLRVIRGIKPFPPQIYSGHDASLQQQKANENRSLCLELSLLYGPEGIIGGRGEEHCGSIWKFGLKMLRA